MSHYYVLDTETTGLDLPRRAVEVAWLRIDANFEVLDEFVARVNPGRPIHPGAIEIHGITDAMVANCPPIEAVIAGLPKPFVAIGHNVSYDLGVLADHVEYSADVCTLALSRRYVKGTVNHKLPTLKEALGLSKQESHSALGDCHTSLELLRHIAKLIGRNLPEIVELESQPKILNTMPFGMHRGKAFSSVPRDYREWLLAQSELHKDIRYTLEKLRIL